MVAHSLSKYAKNITDVVYWVEDSPPLAMGKIIRST